jgi:redox-sensitive bicupin YhaK (pirin superfamily)
MIGIRHAEERGRTRLEWLDSRHSFSFADYRDPEHTGFGVLRVLNEDRVAPGAGFGPHPHRDMEILTVVLSGALAHRDDAGHASLLRAGDVQRMSAGRGILHSERNASDEEPVHFLQIWIEPARRGLAPGYEERRWELGGGAAGLRLLASPDGRADSLTLHQHAYLSAVDLRAGERLEHALAADRRAWLQVVRGRVAVDGVTLGAGDGASVRDATRLALEADADTGLLLFDLP